MVCFRLNRLSFSHITELGTAAIGTYVAVVNLNVDVACHRLLAIDAAAVEVLNVGMVYQPGYVTFQLLLSGTSHLAELTAVDVAFRIIGHRVDTGPEGSRQIEFLKFTSAHGDGNMTCGCSGSICCMRTVTEFLHPQVAAHENIFCINRMSILSGNELVIQAAHQD